MRSKIERNVAVLVLIMGWASALACQAGTPEGALEEMATVNDIDTILKHLPVKVQSAAEKLPLPKRTSIVAPFLVLKNAESQGGRLTKISDGRGLELINREGELLAAVRLKETFVSGSDALVELEIKERNHQWQEAMVEMHYQEGEWRMVRVGGWEGVDVENELMPQVETVSEPNESAAASTLRTLNTSLVAYSTSYPEAGFPEVLQMLSGTDEQESTQDHAKLIDSAFMRATPIRDGYEFHYRAIDPAHYQITATPFTATPSAQKKDKKSFFTDESCIIRSTSEARPANANDPPLE